MNLRQCKFELTPAAAADDGADGDDDVVDRRDWDGRAHPQSSSRSPSFRVVIHSPFLTTSTPPRVPDVQYTSPHTHTHAGRETDRQTDRHADRLHAFVSYLMLQKSLFNDKVIFYTQPTALRWTNKTRSSTNAKIARVSGHDTVQVYSRSPISVSVESPYVISYIMCRTVSKLLRNIIHIFAFILNCERMLQRWSHQTSLTKLRCFVLSQCLYPTSAIKYIFLLAITCNYLCTCICVIFQQRNLLYFCFCFC